MRLSFSCILIVLVTLASCELAVNVDVPYGKDKIVVNSVQGIDSVWSVELTRSRYILSPEYSFEPIESADVIITGSDGTSEQLLYTGHSGRYVGKTYPVSGKTYKISVHSYSLDDVEGQMTMPTVVPIIKIEFDSSGIQPPNSSGVNAVGLPFKVTFKDPPREKNFYSVELFTIIVNQYTNPNTGETVSDTTYNEMSVHIEDPGIASKDDYRQWFNDETFEGTTYTAPMYSSFYLFNSQQYVGLDVRFTSMSEEYYKYINTKDLSYEVDGDPFAQPVPVYSNLSNGFGIFAGAAFEVKSYRNH